jgi:hypothetical protein
VSTQGRWRDWLLFFLRGVREQSIRAVETLRALQALQGDWRARVQSAQLRSRVVARALDLLMERPVLTARVLQQAANCSHVAANAALAELTRLGILTMQGTPPPTPLCRLRNVTPASTAYVRELTYPVRLCKQTARMVSTPFRAGSSFTACRLMLNHIAKALIPIVEPKFTKKRQLTTPSLRFPCTQGEPMGLVPLAKRGGT